MFPRQSYQSNNEMLDCAIQGAHTINNKLFLFEAARMSERDIRAFLVDNDVIEKELQDAYIDYVYMYRIASF